MTINTAEISALWDQRAAFYGEDHADMDRMVDVYNGLLPGEFSDFFHDEMHVHIINMIRLAWDDLANLAGKEFPIYVEPEGDSATEKERAERLEKWAYGVNHAGRPAGGVTMKSLMKVLMWWLVGTANAVAMVLPDFENKSPFFTFRDPRTFYPPTGWTPWNETRTSDALFAYQKPLSQLLVEHPDRADELRNAVARILNLGTAAGGRGSVGEDETWLWVGEYYHEDCWAVQTLGDKAVTLVRSESGDAGHPGVQPVVGMSLYSAVNAKGRSIFADQVSIQAAMARMFSQKLDYYDRTLYPIIFTTPLAGKTVKIGPYAVNEFDPGLGVTPRVDAIGPTNSVDADQTMQFAMGLSRMLNRNPEQMQGVGDADSAKALSELRKGINDTIREGIWPAAVETIPQLYTAASKMDQNLWGSVTKQAKGSRKNANFRITYRPRTLLKGHEYDFEVEPGVGLSGYQGTLELMQLFQAELVPFDDVLEQGEWVRDAAQAKRRIQSDRMEKLMWAQLNAKAAEGMLKPGAMQAPRDMTQKGTDLFDAYSQLDAAGQLYVEPPQEDPMAALLGGMGGPPGGGAPMLPPPSIGALGRGQG